MIYRNRKVKSSKKKRYLILRTVTTETDCECQDRDSKGPNVTGYEKQIKCVLNLAPPTLCSVLIDASPLILVIH